MRFSSQERSHRTLPTESRLHGAGCCAQMTKRRPKSLKKCITLTSGWKEGQYCDPQIINEQSNHLSKTAGRLGRGKRPSVTSMWNMESVSPEPWAHIHLQFPWVTLASFAALPLQWDIIVSFKTRPNLALLEI